MKAFLYSCVILCILASPSVSNALWIGEKFEESSFSNTEGDQLVELVGNQETFLLYKITSRKVREQTLVKVGKKTGVIFALTYSRKFKDIYDVVRWAGTVCEGTVTLPDTYTFPWGFEIPNIPGEKYDGMFFQIFAKRAVMGGSDLGWDLSIECPNFDIR